MFSGFKNFTLALILLIFVTTTIGGTLFLAEPAHAGLPVTMVESIPNKLDKVLDVVWQALKTSILTAASRFVSYGIRKISNDAAVWLASGGKGQSPFAHTKGFGGYLEDVGGEAFGSAIEEIGRANGMNLCKIPDIKADLSLRIGLRTNLGGTGSSGGAPVKPACSFSDFKKNWLDGDAWKSKYSGEALAKRFNTTLAIDDSDLGIQLAATEKIGDRVRQQTVGETLQRQEGQGFIGKTAPISGQIKTPAALQAEGFKGVTPDKTTAKDETNVERLIASGDVKVIPAVLSIFLGDLVGAMTKNFQEKGMLPFGICVGDFGGADCKKSGSNLANYSGGGMVGGRAAAEDLFSEYLTVNINPVESYDIAGQLNACSDSPGTYNCRADSGLMLAAQSTASGVSVTIIDALNRGWLHDWRLLPPARTAENADKNCFNYAYCYSNIKVLRQARVLPLGFEIAANNSDPDKPWTLKQVVGTAPDFKDGFNNCDYIKDSQGNIIGINYDPVNKPFCHLIDPNWVIKIPSTRCNALVNGPNPLAQGVPDRLEECADTQSCVTYNNDGTCKNYAYCTREKNTWRFDADSCDAQFATCRSFVDDSGKNVAYLARTLDTGFCNQDNVGCKAYSLNKDSNGQWATTAPSAPDYKNNVIHFNDKVSSSCGGKSAGCSAFELASSANTLLFLRQAPDYLKCYDSNPATPAVDRPETAADLARLEPSPDCKNYSGACIADEVNCNLYTPVTVGNKFTPKAIPGRYTPASATSWNDQCDAKCVGYAAYREMPSNYSSGSDVANIIPSSGTSCSATDDGCSSFTNLSTATGGVEQTEHYSYLRPCVKPEKDAGKNFITYEGSKVGGFQLKAYRLVADTDGAPKYFYKTSQELDNFNADCTEARYKAGAASLDCRQFNDAQGAVYYRLLAQTIPVSESCTPYRLNNPETYQVNGAPTCFQNGEYRDGFCFYDGLPAGAQNTAGISRSCSASVDTCRGYKGNAGNNIQEIVNDNFESASSSVALKGWAPATVSLSPESTHVGEHSLDASGAGAQKYITLDAAGSYDLTFWAKGSAGNITVGFSSTSTNFSKTFGTQSVGDVWNFYHVGPIEWTGASGGGQLTFTAPGGGRLFLDNIRLVEVAANIYLVKKTLKVDPVCDSHLNDNLPGEALGCAAYTDANKNTVYLKNFSYLCREEAVGCTALLDTKNTVTDSRASAYNVWLAGTGREKVEKTIGNDTYSCTVDQGKTGCYVDIAGHTANEIATIGVFDASTVYIPPDTATTTPIYLVATKEASCNQADLGCVAAGLETKTPSGSVFTTTTIKNNPDDPDYSKQLCVSEAVGCNAYSDGASTAYFKDPVSSGQKICAYRSGVVIGGTARSGWFWKNVGSCSNSAAGSPSYCSSDSDCGAGNKCNGSGDQACYPDYLQSGGIYGLWSYGVTDKYKNFVGECPVAQDKCTEFVDHNGNDQAFYLLKNSKISGGNCNGQVSQKAGCALFDQTDNPNKFWSSAETYAESARQDSQLVAAKQSVDPAKNDTNIIISVKPDRTCGEWLQCKSSHRVWDEKNGKWKNICDDIGRCDKSADVGGGSGTSLCANWVGGKTGYAGQILTEELYANRDTSWVGMDFDGFSIPGLYPAEELAQVNVAPTSTAVTSPEWRLLKRIPCGKNCALGVTSPSTEFLCVALPDTPNCGLNLEVISTGPCNPPATCGASNEGVCLAGVCVQKSDGSHGGTNVKDTSPRHSCRAYPEVDSPFPFTDAVAGTSPVQQFSGVNRCNEGNFPSLVTGYYCDCDYTKVKYGDTITKYWNYTLPNIVTPKIKISDKGAESTVALEAGQTPDGICQGGKMSGFGCVSDGDCVDTSRISPLFPDGVQDGTCQKRDKVSKLLGWRGFCLEEDLSRFVNGDQKKHPCLTWYPIDSVTGALDINNQHVEAGYENPSKGGKYYCLQGNQSLLPTASQDAGDKLKYTVRGSLMVSSKGTDDASPIATAAVANDPGVVAAQKAIDLITEKSKTSGDYATITESFAFKDANKVLANAVAKALAAANVTIAPDIGKTDYEPRFNPTNGVIAVVALAHCMDPLENPDVAASFGTSLPLCLTRNSIALLTLKEAQFYKTSFSVKDDERLVSRPDIEYIELTVKSQSTVLTDSDHNFGTPPVFGNPPNRTKFRIWPNDLVNNKVQVFYEDSKNDPQGLDTTKSNRAITAQYLGSVHDFVLLFSTSGYLVKDSSSFTYPNGLNGIFTAEDGLKAGDTSLKSEGIWDLSVTSQQLCPVDGNRGEWHAIRFRFDKDTKKFLGYDTAYCNNAQYTNVDQTDFIRDISLNPLYAQIEYSVSFRMRQWCSVIADASVDSSTNGAVAWTDRLWKQDRYKIENLDYDFSTAFSPSFGSLEMSSVPTGNATVLSPNGLWVDTGAGKTCPDGFGCVLGDTTPTQPESKYTQLLPGYGTEGAPYSCNPKDKGGCVRYDFSVSDPANRIISTLAGQQNYSGGQANLGQIFARLNQIYVTSTLNSYYARVSAPNSSNFTENSVQAKAPRVFPLGTCDSQDNCLEGETGGVTINDKVKVDEDVKAPDGQVFLRFFAYANENQMPLRKIAIDWGYGDTRPYAGLFRNHRGFVAGKCDVDAKKCLKIDGSVGESECFADRDCPQLQQCVDQSTAKNFGQIENKTCDNTYFSFEHTYRCLKGDVAHGYQASCSGFPDGCCVFTPKVQVKDNWGWYNGACSGEPGGNGCYDKLWGKSKQAGVSDLPNSIDEGTTAGAWTPFAGKVFVSPK